MDPRPSVPRSISDNMATPVHAHKSQCRKISEFPFCLSLGFLIAILACSAHFNERVSLSLAQVVPCSDEILVRRTQELQRGLPPNKDYPLLSANFLSSRIYDPMVTESLREPPLVRVMGGEMGSLIFPKAFDRASTNETTSLLFN